MYGRTFLSKASVYICLRYMKIIRTYCTRFVLFVLALQILNLSVYGSEYTQQFMDANGHSASARNQIDCLAEYVAEVVLNHHNAMPEHKGNHTKNEQKLIKAPIQLFAQNNPESATYKVQYPVIVKYAYYNNQYDYLFYKEINPPPPKQA